MMDGKSEDRSKGGESGDEIEREANKNREALDEIPPPGTDPLHEGP